jgi:class 3 adenylate cyclase
MGCGAPLGATASSREVRKTVTALFCDLVGSTSLGETHDPEVLRPLLEQYFAIARGAVERHGGRVEKFIGDAVSAVFGLPVAHEDDALRAVRAAVEIQARLAELAAGSAFPLAVRIGITTGEVLVPGDGTPLIGDAMNTAARLQAAAEPGQVLVGEPTYHLVRDAVVAEPVEPLALRGKAEPVPAYRVLQVASLSPMRTRRLDAPMVGRRRESALLESAYERAASDRACQLFTVLGAAGAGKSRLVEEFLSSHPDGDVLRGRCLPYGEGITWYPVTEALRGALGLPDFADADAVRTAIHTAIGGEEHAASIEANLARLFAAGEGGAPEETFWAIRRFLESRGRERPLVLVLDDIHWGEPTFLDFVEHVADWSRDAAILLLCMARPDLLDVRPSWGGGKTNATTISLAPLSDAECGTLIVGLLGSTALPEAVRDRITSVAEGNPLFVEEMLRMLVDDGRLVREGALWVATGDLAEVHVPPTISALLSARLDRLSDPERAILEAAAVEGKEFHRDALAALLPGAVRAGIDVHLRSLTRKELVSPDRSSLPGEDAFRFHHLLIRDAAYDAIPKADRASLHAAFADWLEAVAGERVVEQEAIAGYHLERAYRYREELGLPEDHELRLRAARALGAAGARALDAGDVQAAVDLLRPAADLARGEPAELEILERFATALHDAADEHASGVVLERLAAVAAAAGDAAFLMRARAASFMQRVTSSPEGYELREQQELMEAALATYRERGHIGSCRADSSCSLTSSGRAGEWSGCSTSPPRQWT